MTLRKKLSRAGLDFIKAHEGYRRRAAELPSGGWVVGYSHTQTAAAEVEVEPEEAEQLLLHDLKPIVGAVNDLVLAPLTQNQFDALVSLAFNIGPRQFRLSGIVRHVNEGRPLDAAASFDVWRKAEVEGEAVVVDALVRRRAMEKALFLTPDAPIAAPTAELRVVADPNAVYVAPMEGAVRASVDLNGERAVPVVAGSEDDAEPVSAPAQAAANEIIARLNRILPAGDEAAPNIFADPALGSGEEKSPSAHPLAPGPAPAPAALKTDPEPSQPPPSTGVASAPPFGPPPGGAILHASRDEPVDVSPRQANAPAHTPERNGARGVFDTDFAWTGEVEAERVEKRGGGWNWLVGLVGLVLILASAYGLAAVSGMAAQDPSRDLWRAGSVVGLVSGVLAVFSAVYGGMRGLGHVIEE